MKNSWPSTATVLIVRLMLVIAGVILLRPIASGQSVASEADSSSPAASSTPNLNFAQPHLSYLRPTTKIKFRNYLFDSFGPYPIAGSAIAAALNQAYNTPPEWSQGAAGYGRRFGSALGILTVTTTTRYALAAAFGEDTLYYPCECRGTFPRLGHALISTLTARRGEDGHRVFSLPSLVAPYAGSMTAVYAWYPDRFNAKDGFRIGNYSLLAAAAGNVAFEFVYGGPHTLLSRMHLKNSSAAPNPDPKP